MNARLSVIDWTSHSLFILTVVHVVGLLILTCFTQICFMLFIFKDSNSVFTFYIYVAVSRFIFEKLESVIGEYDVFGICLLWFPLCCQCSQRSPICVAPLSSAPASLALCFLGQSAPFFFSVSSPHRLHLSRSLQLHLVLSSLQFVCVSVLSVLLIFMKILSGFSRKLFEYVFYK